MHSLPPRPGRTGRRWVLALALCGATVAGGAASAPAPRPDVPVLWEEARVWVPVHGGGHALGWWVLDTGVWTTLLDVGTAERLGLPVELAGETSGAGSGRMRQGTAGPVTLTVGTVPLVARRASVSPIDAVLAPFLGRRVPGIVGAPFFAEHVVELDVAERRVRVDPPGPLAGLEVPLEVEGGIPFARVRLVRQDGSSVEARALVDLGAKAAALLTESFLSREPRASFGPTARASLGAGVGGETRYDFARLPRIELPGRGGVAVLEDALVGLSVDGTLRGPWGDLLLGAEFLAHWTVRFDLAHHRMVLGGPLRARDGREHDLSGLFLVAEGPDLRSVRIHRVEPGSPGADAGVRAGDRLVSVEGRSASDWTLPELRALLRERPGRRVTLVVERDGAERRTSLVERRLL